MPFIVFGKPHITYRLPSEKEIPAHRIRWKKEDIILDSSKPKLKNYKQGGLPPADYEEHCAWEFAPCHVFVSVQVCFRAFVHVFACVACILHPAEICKLHQ